MDLHGAWRGGQRPVSVKKALRIDTCEEDGGQCAGFSSGGKKSGPRKANNKESLAL
jgi:hypothetical protein